MGADIGLAEGRRVNYTSCQACPSLFISTQWLRTPRHSIVWNFLGCHTVYLLCSIPRSYGGSDTAIGPNYTRPGHLMPISSVPRGIMVFGSITR
jgi:hypothetical protein